MKISRSFDASTQSASLKAEFSDCSEIFSSSNKECEKIEICKGKNNFYAGGFIFGSRLKKPLYKSDDYSCPHIFMLHENSRNSQETKLQTFFVSARKCIPIHFSGEQIGCVLDCGEFSQLFIFGLRPTNISASPKNQATEVFESFKLLLEKNGFTFLDVVRTWFYNRDILGWYRDFNEARTNFFNENRVFDNIVPASTGIGADNPHGAAICAGLHAIRSIGGKVSARAVESPLQESAMNYRSSFSRAVEIAFPGWRKLYVSGTASINKSGETTNVGNCARQTAETMRIIEALLKSRDMAWENVCRAIAYFRNASDIPLFEQFCSENNLPKFPVIAVNATICRDDLLFELELDALAE